MNASFRPSRNNFKGFGIALFIVVVTLFSSCADDSEIESEDLPSDETIVKTIETQLKDAEGVPADSIQVAVEDGIVRLNGSITNLLAKKRASEIAKSVGGVVSVINTLKITASRSDEAINEDVAKTLSTDPATENREINSTVNNGMVTLKGAVDSWQEKQLASTIVSGVKGVKGIDNAIIVADNEDRKAPDIKAEIKSALLYDARIGDERINVEVTNGIVTLGGSVGSAAEKRLAIKKAHVTGVEKVAADRLQVRPELKSMLFRNKMISTLTPEEIKNAIRRTFVYDPRVPAEQISVTLEEGVAILSGNVEYLNAKISAAADARNTAGVKSVENNITVKRKVVVQPEAPVTDEAIKSRIINAIRRDPYVEEIKVTVNVDDGFVELIGDVNSEFEKEQIEEIVANIKGIVRIDNKLKVKPEEDSAT